MFYTARMSRIVPKPPEPPATLSLKIGEWFQADATGWGVLCVPLVVLLLLAATLAMHLGLGAMQ